MIASNPEVELPYEMPQTERWDLQERMQRVRAKRAYRVAEFRMEAERVTDWREHVKSAPIPSLVGSVLLGFVAIQSVKRLTSLPATRKVESPMANPFQATSPSSSGYVMNHLIRVLTGVLVSAGKNYLAKQWEAHTNKARPSSIPPFRK